MAHPHTEVPTYARYDSPLIETEYIQEIILEFDKDPVRIALIYWVGKVRSGDWGLLADNDVAWVLRGVILLKINPYLNHTNVVQ